MSSERARVGGRDLVPSADARVHPAGGRKRVGMIAPTSGAATDVVRGATLGSYGVIGFAGGGIVDRVGQVLGLAPHGVVVRLDDGLTVDLDLVVAHGVPIAEVARQVDSAVRYAIRRALGRRAAGRAARHRSDRGASRGRRQSGRSRRQRDGRRLMGLR